MHLGSETVINFRAHRNVITTIQKDASEIKSFKLNKENCKIDWTKSAAFNQRLEHSLVHSFRQN
jgi:methionyl-tRNA formyltransferase